MAEDAPREKRTKTRRVGQVIERGKNKYLIAIFRGYKPNGKNDYFYKTFHGTKTQAEQWLREALTRRDRGEPLEDPDILYDSLFNEWLDSEKRQPRTLEIYLETYDRYVKPTFGASKLSSITSRAAQKWINDMVKDGYGNSTVRLAFAVFRLPINYALDHEMLLKTPLKGVKPPPEKKRQPNVLEPEEALKVLKVCRKYPGGIFIAFMLWSGTRPNEACGLQWKDIDWEQGSITINRNLIRLQGQMVWEFGPPKTDSGYRSFTMPESFMKWLKEHRQEQLEQRMKVGHDWYDYDLVFANEIGEPLSTIQYRYMWKQILANAGVSEERRKMRPYDVRHSVATLMLLERVPTKVVSNRLGHSKTWITEDVYQHVLKRMQAQATEDLERVILNGKKL